MALDDLFRENLANWDERVAGHAAPDGYVSFQLLETEPDHITEVVRFDAEQLGDVRGLTLLHSQCHIGTDTMSWANLGATVTGLDFSPSAIAASRDLASRMGNNAQFVETRVDHAPQHIDDTFDIVYTGVGAICWLPDIDEWAKIMAGFVRPGGRFYIRDTHPMLLALDDTRTDSELVVSFRYFDNGEEQTFTNEASYLGSATLKNGRTHEWPHSISSIVNALLDAGLVIERLNEYQHLDFEYFPWMERRNDQFVLPDELRDRVPLQFSILATKPSAV